METNALSTAGELSEQALKERFVPFLKDFYRKRFEPVAGTFSTSFDNVADGGIVADGLMRFRKNDGSEFSCTFEASSRDKLGEVKYQTNLVYFLWDCAAFAGVCISIAYIASYIWYRPWLIGLHAAGNVGFMLGIGLIAFFGWYFTMSGWRKYRYIFAIEQFKQYEADEQWIVLSEDVFPAPNDPYMQELRDQCVYNGFGLAIISAVLPVRLVCAPSRLGIYGRDRKMAHWVTRTQWYQTVAQGVQTAYNMRQVVPGPFKVLWNKLTRPIIYLFWEPVRKGLGKLLAAPFNQSANVYNRFMEGQQVQKMVLLLSLTLCSWFVYDVLRYREENIADPETYSKQKTGKNPEDQPGYLIDGQPIPYDGKAPGVPKQYPRQEMAYEEDVPTINLSGEDDMSVEQAAPKMGAKPKTAATDPCARIGKGWIIQENAFSSRAFAEERVNVLRKNGLEAAWVSAACLQNGRSGYVVYLGKTFASESVARDKAGYWAKVLRQKGLGNGQLMLRKR